MALLCMWDRFIDSLDSPGGHILVLLGLLGAGIAIGSMELEMASAGALFALLRTTTSNHARQQTPAPKES